ncbi:L,D-transpeptidase family protein [Pedobacter boryungensis]|uniref:L,D-transpeptidase family protein n=1 Tax=Pedobacter boryungensis TaxID=869962 RepID=A0ABX2DEP9_9SPHI|nr:L,D-transpeptidase family protein [Pedobacter boryungensis]NQX31609.1 L,D-transpeptidase family protein [Pedobacter boryungensis]
MKVQNRALTTQKKDDTKTILIIGIVILFLQLAFHLTVSARPIEESSIQRKDSLNYQLGIQLNNPQMLKRLNFPNTVKRFYEKSNFETNWLTSEENSGPTVMAMLLLDCVKQYGLQLRDYHPEILTYEKLHNLFSVNSQISTAQKIEFELMLSDAMVSMINNLHYGAFNPTLNRFSIDNGIKGGLYADVFLHTAIKSPNLRETILTVQPNIDQYKQLQAYMKLIMGQYACDSYETPEQEIRTIAINMERLRWIGIENSSYLFVNIPSFKLTYYTNDKTLEYKIVVGKASTPTPTLVSTIGYLETAPDWKIPSKIFINEMLPKAQKDLAYFENNHMAVYDQKEHFVPINVQTLAQIKQNPKIYHARQTAGCDNALGKVVFRFANPHDIYLHDTPEQQYFSQSKRAFSHGCIRVSNAEQLAQILMENDGQGNRIADLKKSMANYNKQRFALKKPLPIIITYLTITVEDGLLAKHADIYLKDKSLENKMFK